MPIDASIALQGKLPQIESPLNSLANVLQVQGAQQQNQLGAMKLDEYNRSTAETKATNDAYREATGADGTIDRNRLYSRLASGGAGSKLPSIQKEFTAQDTALAAQKKAEIEAHLKKFEVAGQIMNGVTDQVTWDRARAQTAQVFGPEAVAQMPAAYDPALVEQKRSQAMTVKDQLEQQWKALDHTLKVDQFGETKRHNAEGEKLTARGQDVTVRGQNLVDKRAGETLNMHYAVAGMNPDGTAKTMPVAVDGSLDLTKVAPEDLAAAHRYRADGTLPSNMGRGAQGAMESKRIRAIASALDAQAGESPEDARVRQLALKGDVNAVAAMRKREVAIGANVKNFDFNADQVVELSRKVDRTGVPIINAWVNAGRRSVTGNPELAAFDTAVKTTVNEFAQIVSGTTSGASTEGEKKKAEALLNAQQTPEQIISVINQMRIESKNRMQSFASQRKESMPTNGPRPAAAPAAAPAPVAPGAAPKGWTYIGPVK